MGALSTGPALRDGRAWPLGATVEPDGVNFAVFSAHATAMSLCLYDAHGQRELARHVLPGRSGDVWHGKLPGAGAGLVYGLRADGPWSPPQGQRFNPNKLLLDPYAREIVGTFDAACAGAKAAMVRLDDAKAMGSWTLSRGGTVMLSLPRIAFLRTILLNHSVHHRGQLSVYLRLLDVPVPPIYGPSADENPFG